MFGWDCKNFPSTERVTSEREAEGGKPGTGDTTAG